MRVTMHAATSSGPREINEDHYVLLPRLGLAIVCDGMGGHPQGDVAARRAAESAARYLANQAEALREAASSTFHRARLLDIVRDAVDFACGRVHRKAKAEGGIGMGTTLSLLIVVEGVAVVAHVGDCRVYLLRNGELHQLTQDHTVAAELIRSGVLEPGSTAVHRYSRALSRAIGLQPSVQVDALMFDVLPGDRFLLCSDGITDVISDDELRFTLGRPGPDRAEVLLQRAKEEKTRDDSTAITVRVHEPEDEVVLLRTTLVQEMAKLLSGTQLMRGLSFTEEKRVLRHLTPHQVAAGDVVIEEGEVLPGALVVLFGTLREESPDGTVRRVGSDSILEPVAAVEEREATTTVVAETGARVVWLPLRTIAALTAESPVTALQVVMNLLRTQPDTLPAEALRSLESISLPPPE